MAHRPRYPLRSKRVNLRPLTPADSAAMLAYRSIPDVCRWVPFEPMTEATIRDRLTTVWSRSTLDTQGDGLTLGVERNDSGELIGDVMLRWVSALDRCGEVGYVLNPAFAGQGYATEAVHLLMHLGFDQFRWHRIIARVDARNTASANVAGRLGMRQEAHLVENEWFKGQWSDELDFALLEAEWLTQHSQGCPLDH